MKSPRLILLCGAIVCLAQTAFALSVTVPNNLNSVDGDNANSYPFNPAPFGQTSVRIQEVYAASQFASVPAGGGWITQILFRPDATYGAAFSGTLPSMRIDLSTTSAAVDNLSTTFANNIGANAVTVFPQAALTLSSSFTGSAGGPKNFDIVINLITPFFYNPAAGNLLLDVRNFGGGTTTPFDSAEVVGDSVSRVGAFNNQATGVRETTGLVTRFTIVPEPTSFVLLGISLTAMSLFRLRGRVLH